MRLIIGLLVCWSLSAAPALVQQKTKGNNSGNGGTTLTSATTTGNSIFALISILSTDSIDPASPPTIDGQVLTLGPSTTVTGAKVLLYYLNSITGGSGVCTVSTLGATKVTVNWSEFSGLSNAGPEATNTNTGVASSTVTTNSVTPASANNLVIALGGWTANDYSSGPTNSFTRMTQICSGTTLCQEGAYLIQVSATAQSTGWSLTAGINWAASVAVFGAPSTGPTNAQRSAGFWVIP